MWQWLCFSVHGSHANLWSGSRKCLSQLAFIRNETCIYMYIYIYIYTHQKNEMRAVIWFLQIWHLLSWMLQAWQAECPHKKTTSRRLLRHIGQLTESSSSWIWRCCWSFCSCSVLFWRCCWSFCSCRVLFWRCCWSFCSCRVLFWRCCWSFCSCRVLFWRCSSAWLDNNSSINCCCCVCVASCFWCRVSCWSLLFCKASICRCCSANLVNNSLRRCPSRACVVNTSSTPARKKYIDYQVPWPKQNRKWNWYS